MSAQPKDVQPAPEATKADLLDLWSPKRRTLVVDGFTIHVRALTVEERARCEKIEAPSPHDAVALGLAMGCIKENGEPMFGPFAEALEITKKLGTSSQMENVVAAIFELSGMTAASARKAEGN